MSWFLRCYPPRWHLIAGFLAATASGWGVADNGEQYARLLADSEAIAAHNELVIRQLDFQTQQVSQIKAQLAGLDTTAAELGPLLLRMHAALTQFVDEDLPFADPVADRHARLKRLDQLMNDAAVSDAERFRRLIEAYQIELDYGRRLETYQARLGDDREAEFVRVGRIALLYHTTDGEEAGYWNQREQQWVVDKSYRRAISEALRIARKELAPDLIAVPVSAPRGDD